MAYPQLEELTSRKREKVALFFTAEHMAGMLAVGLPAYVATLGTTFWLRALRPGAGCSGRCASHQRHRRHGCL